MRRSWLIVPAVAVALPVLLVLGLAVLSHLMPLNFLKTFAGVQVSKAINRPVAATGDLWLRLGPTLRLSATGVSILNPPDSHFPEEAFATAARAEVDMPLWSLLAGSPVVSRSVIEKGSLVFQIRADGVNNWNLSETTDDRTGESLNFPESLTIRDSRLALLDVPADQDSEILHLDIDFRPIEGGWALDAAGQIQDKPVVVHGESGAAASPDAYTLRIDLESALLTASLSGQVFEGAMPGLNGSLDIDTPDYGGLAEWLQVPLDPRRPNPGALRLSADMTADGSHTVVRTLSLRGSGIQVDAGADLSLAGEAVRLRGEAKVTLLDLEAYLPPESEVTELPTPIVNLAVFQAIRHIADLPDTPVPLDWLEQFDADYRVTLGDLRAGALRLRDAQARLAVADQVARLRLAPLDAGKGGATEGAAEQEDGARDQVAAGTGRLVVSLRKLPEAGQAVAGAEMRGVARAMPVGEMALIPGGDRAQAYLDGDLTLSAQGATWRRLASGLQGSLSAGLGREPGPDAVPVWHVEAKAPDTDEAITAMVELKGPQASQKMALTSAPVKEILSADRFPVKAELTGDLGSGLVDGSVLLRPVPGFAGKVAFQSDHAGALLRLVSGAPGLAHYDPGPMKLDAELEEQDQTVKIRSARFESGKAVLELSGSIERRQQQVHVDLQATGSDIDLDRLLPGGTGAAKGTRSGWLPEAPRWPLSEAFPASTVAGLKAELTGLSGMGLTFAKFSLQADMAPERLSLKADGDPAGGGHGTLSLALARTDDVAALDLDLSLEGTDLRALFGANGPTGSASLSASAKGSGATAKALAQSLTGTAKLEIASLRHPDLHPVDHLSATLEAKADLTGLKAEAVFPVPQAAADTAVGIATSAGAVAAPESHPADLALNCKAGLWECATAGEKAVDMTLTSGPSSLSFDGQTRHGPGIAALAGNLHLKGERLADWDGIADDVLPHFGPYDLQAKIDLSRTKLDLQDMRLTVGGSDLAGTVQSDLTATRPVTDLDLKSDRLNTADFGSRAAQHADVAGRARLSTGWLDWMQGRAKLAVSELLLADGWKVQEVSLDQAGKGDRLDLNRLEGRFLDGQVGLAGHLAPGGEGAAVALRGDWQQADLAALAQGLHAGQGISGRLDATFDVTSSGTTMRELATRPSGEMSMRIDQGHIANDLLGLLSVTLSDLFSPLFGGRDATRLNCFVADASAREGAIQVPGLSLDTDLFDMTGKGSLSLPQASVDMDFAIMGLRVSVASLAPAFTVSGPLADPSIDLDPGRTALDLAPSVLGSLAGEVVHMVQTVTGGDTGNAAQPCPALPDSGGN